MSGALSLRDARPAAVAATETKDSDAYPRDATEQHGRLVRWYEEAERSSMTGREWSERDRAYYDGYQLTQAETDALRARGQPPIVINKIKTKVELLCGLERKARTDPKAWPRTPTEEARADAATQALRFIAEDNDFHVLRSGVYNEMLVEGFGGIEIGLVDDGQGGADITHTQVHWDRLWHDPHSREPDFTDARYLGMVVWMDRDEALLSYPDSEDVFEDTFSSNSGHSRTYGDKPNELVWTDNRRQRVRIVSCHWREGDTWWEATYTRGGLLVPPKKSWFVDKRGKSACRLLLQSAYVDRENRRYGMVRDLISLQDEINKRRSKALHLLSVQQVIAEQGAVEDVDRARREVARPDGFITVTPGLRFEVQRTADLASGQFELLKHATEEMQLSGPNAAMSGTDNRELSGRAILAQQAGGAVQNEPLADSLRMWARRVYEMSWMAARKAWTAGKWVRVTDDLGATRWVGVNMQITLRDELAKMPDQQRALAMQQLQIVPGDPRLDAVIRVENQISDLDIDIAIEEGQDIPSLQAETFQSLVQLASVQPGLIPGDVLIAASSLRNKADLLNRMKAHQEQQQQAQQQQAPLIQAHAEADVAQKRARAAADNALAAERAHSVHAGFVEMQQPPPDAPSAPDTVMPPEVQAMHDAAMLRGMHAKAAVDEARANDLMHAATERVAGVHAMHHAMQNPQPAAPP